MTKVYHLIILYIYIYILKSNFKRHHVDILLIEEEHKTHYLNHNKFLLKISRIFCAIKR